MGSTEIHRGFLPGCIGRLAELHGTYYATHSGFDLSFEIEIARELGRFWERYAEERDGLWLAVLDGRVEGSIAIDSGHPEGVRLRWFILAEPLHGLGVGTRLMTAALDFCRERAYSRVHLITFATLEAARHLYLEHGFSVVSEKGGKHWGRELVLQRYERG